VRWCIAWLPVSHQRKLLREGELPYLRSKWVSEVSEWESEWCEREREWEWVSEWCDEWVSEWVSECVRERVSERDYLIGKYHRDRRQDWEIFPGIQTHIYPYIRTYIHTLIHSHTHTLIHSYINTLIHSYTHTLIHSYTHTLIHSYTHTLIHSYTHTLIHSYNMHSYDIPIIVLLFISQIEQSHRVQILKIMASVLDIARDKINLNTAKNIAKFAACELVKSRVYIYIYS